MHGPSGHNTFDPSNFRQRLRLSRPRPIWPLWAEHHAQRPAPPNEPTAVTSPDRCYLAKIKRVSGRPKRAGDGRLKVRHFWRGSLRYLDSPSLERSNTPGHRLPRLGTNDGGGRHLPDRGQPMLTGSAYRVSVRLPDRGQAAPTCPRRSTEASWHQRRGPRSRSPHGRNWAAWAGMVATASANAARANAGTRGQWGYRSLRFSSAAWSLRNVLMSSAKSSSRSHCST